MRKLAVAAVLTVATLAVAAPAGAGGWAVTTLDPLVAAPLAGEPFEVGFTIRQHGRTPISLDDTAILVSGSDGAVTRFAARPEGAVGHHVATLVLPAGEVTWAVDQGWFADQELGALTVGTGGAAGTGGGGSASPWTAPLFAVAALLAGLGLADLARIAATNRRRPAVTA